MIEEVINVLIRIIQKIFKIMKQFFHPAAKQVHFENGPTVTIDAKIAEGGFSYIYSATDSMSRKYALKRIMCSDDEMLIACRREVDVHRRVRGENVLHLFNMKFVTSQNPTQRMCYMLFPLITGGSLRDEVSKRKLLSDNLSEVRPWSERQLLTLFKGILKGVRSLHEAGFAHCDVKLENCLLDRGMGFGDRRGDEETSFVDLDLGVPILMDFGSARNLVVKLTDRRTVLRLTEEASKNSTVCYRAPELFDGGCRHGPLEPDVDGKVDVWSCGCLLYGMMYGTSPFEMEFRHDGSVRIVECTHLRVLGDKIPQAPAARESFHTYRNELIGLVEWMLTVDRSERPALDEVFDRVENILSRGGNRVIV